MTVPASDSEGDSEEQEESEEPSEGMLLLNWMGNELSVHYPVLLIGLLGFVGVSGSLTFVHAVTSAQVLEALGLSVGEYSSAIATGGLCKALLHMTLAGPLLLALGPDRAVALGILLVAFGITGIGLATSQTIWRVSLWWTVSTAILCEQPAHVVVLSSYFRKQLPFGIAAVNAGYSGAGTLIPLVLTPLLLATSWRAVYMVWATYLVVMACVDCCFFRMGPIPLTTAKGAGAPADDEPFLRVGAAATCAPKELSSVPQSVQPAASLGEVLSKWTFWALVRHAPRAMLRT